jgi:Protein of unknown function (DUF2933)
MNTSPLSRYLALTAPMPHEGTRPPRPSAAWASVPVFLRGHGGLAILAAALAATGLLAGWAWLGAAAILPLLYTLPCAAMMLMCMKGHGGSDRSASAKPGATMDPNDVPPTCATSVPKAPPAQELNQGDSA